MSALTRPAYTWPLTAAFAAASGALLALGFAPFMLWPAPILGVGLLTWVVAGQRLRAGFVHGLLAGISMNAMTIWWVGAQAGPAVWALVVVMALWTALVGVLSSCITRLPGWWLIVPTAWGAVEYGASVFPFGGFPWVRLGYTAIDQPLAGWFPILGTPGVTWLAAFVGCAALAAITHRTWIPAAAGLMPFAVGGGLLLIPVEAGGETVSVGMVQGSVTLNADTGYIAATGATPHHLSETVFTLADARAHGQTLDMIVWAENSTDVDPEYNATTRSQIVAALELAQVPIDLGALTVGPLPETRQTTTQVWVPGQGIWDEYHKRNLAPFGEFVPLRDLIEPYFPDVKRVGAQSVPGTEPGVVNVPIASNPELRVGTVICYELAYDTTVYDTVNNGADILVAQSTTHNFSGTSEPQQQMVINRVRAAELRREFVASTLNGYSGLIDAKGAVIEPTTEYTAAHRVYQVPVRHNQTLALHLAPVLGLAQVLVVLVGFAWAFRIPGSLERTPPS